MSKTNSNTATLRDGNKPKASEVKTLSLKNDNDKVRKDAVEKQNTSLTSDGTRIVNVISNSGKSILSHPKGGE
jgi:hypothetical protein